MTFKTPHGNHTLLVHVTKRGEETTVNIVFGLSLNQSHGIHVHNPRSRSTDSEGARGREGINVVSGRGRQKQLPVSQRRNRCISAPANPD